MKYLFDTHIILWALVDDNRINNKVKNILTDSKNEIYYSSVSTWEIEIKHLNRENFNLSGEQFAFLCDQNGLANTTIKNSNIVELKNLKKTKNIKNNDLFDKMLLAQAISENMIFITHDKKFSSYSNSNIMLV